ncbi:hypothetical protein FM103_09425 [Corynebacterium xerosis]|nr:hypothetical protein FM103_09425 [Corynebacterium xerosis]
MSASSTWRGLRRRLIRVPVLKLALLLALVLVLHRLVPP